MRNRKCTTSSPCHGTGFYSRELKERLGTHLAYEDLPLDMERMKRWHPLNRSLYIGYKTMLCGMLLNHKGDPRGDANSVETRYPFLDDDVIKLCSRVHPRWKLRRARYDKYLLRCAATRYCPMTLRCARRRCFERRLRRVSLPTRRRSFGS